MIQLSRWTSPSFPYEQFRVLRDSHFILTLSVLFIIVFIFGTINNRIVFTIVYFSIPIWLIIELIAIRQLYIRWIYYRNSRNMLSYTVPISSELVITSLHGYLSSELEFHFQDCPIRTSKFKEISEIRRAYHEEKIKIFLLISQMSRKEKNDSTDILIGPITNENQNIVNQLIIGIDNVIQELTLGSKKNV